MWSAPSGARSVSRPTVRSTRAWLRSQGIADPNSTSYNVGRIAGPFLIPTGGLEAGAAKLGERGAIVGGEKVATKLTEDAASSTPQILKNKAIGDAAADAIARRYPGARREVTLQAASGPRRLDVLTSDGLAIESKVGRTSLGSRERQEIARDVELLNDPTSQVRRLMWEFSTSPTTGLGGPTSGLAAALLRNRIPFTVVR